MPSHSRISRAFSRQLCPKIETSPEVGSSKPSKISIVVVFPAPFGPSRPKHSPVWISRLSPRTASTLPSYVLRRSRHWIARGIERFYRRSPLDGFQQLSSALRFREARGIVALRPLDRL